MLKCGNEKTTIISNNFQWRDYFVVRITQTAHPRPSEYPGHGLIVQTNTCACRHIATVRILEPFFWGGGVQKVFYFPCFGITKHHLNIFTR